jgi:hypothetical protein
MDPESKLIQSQKLLPRRSLMKPKQLDPSDPNLANVDPRRGVAHAVTANENTAAEEEDVHKKNHEFPVFRW